MLTIQEFCDKHKACEDGKAWALENCKDMQEVWDTIKPHWIVWVATLDDVLTSIEYAEFALFCASQVKHMMKDERSIKALEVARKYIDGEASIDELEKAKAAAYAAYAALPSSRCGYFLSARVAAYAASAAAYAAYAASYDASAAAAYAACAASYAASYAAAASAASYAVSAASADIEKAQAKWLRENTKPNFN